MRPIKEGDPGRRWYGWIVDVALDFKTPWAPLVKLPRFYRPTGKIAGRHAMQFTVVGLHLIVLAWHWWRYDRWLLEELLFQIGWMEGDDPEVPTYESLRFGSPWRILEKRELRRRAASTASRDYAIRRTIEEVREERAAELHEAYRAHAATFGALQSISLALPVPWAGEVDNYDDIVKAVVDVIEQLDRANKAHALAATSTVGLGK